MAQSQVTVIAIDGPSGSGKGTLCQRLARDLGWHLLDSGALYRIVGLAAERAESDFDDGEALAQLASSLDVAFQPGPPGEPAEVLLAGENISAEVRTESTGELASKVAVHQGVRDALMALQQSFAKVPGLIADGRDMGTVVFPEAGLKVYLTASAECRADRRYKQLKGRGQSVNLAALLKDIQARDERDMNRAVAPLKPAADAVVVDSSSLDADQVYDKVREVVEFRLGLKLN